MIVKKAVSLPGVVAKKKVAKKKITKKSRRAKVRTNPCLCGCGELTAYTLCRGHIQRIRGWLLRLRAGEGSPKEVGMSAELARKLGPWKPKGDGLVPTKDYDSLIH